MNWGRREPLNNGRIQEYKEYKAELKQSKNGITWAEPLSDFQKKVYAICEKPYQSTFKRTTVGDPKRKSYMFSSLDLIKVFKDKPIIWDNDYQCSCFAADREREYQDMAKKFPRAEEQMRLKIRSLKLHYEKERWRRNTMGPKNIWPLFKYLTFLEKNYEDNGETKHSSTCAFALEKKYLNEKEESPELIEPILEVVKVEVTDEADEPMTPVEEKYHPTEESPTVFTVSTVAESEINPPPPPSNPTCNPADRRSVDLFFDFLHKSFEERNISHEQFMEFADYSIKFLKTVSASKSSS
ncbi:hypothetical protein DMENIID0001_007210 [Sergentomyia squamirostris]